MLQFIIAMIKSQNKGMHFIKLMRLIYSFLKRQMFVSTISGESLLFELLCTFGLEF